MPIRIAPFNVTALEQNVRKRGAAQSFASQIGAPLFEEVSARAIASGEVRGFFLAPITAADGPRPLGEVLKLLPPPWLKALQQGRAGIIFDNSREGRNHRDDLARRLHESLQALSINPRQVIHVTQDRTHVAHYENWSRRQQVADQIHILTYDFYVRRHFTESWRNLERVFQKKRRRFLKDRVLEKQFVCLNFKPRAWRIALLTRLLRDGLWDEGFVSFGGLEVDNLAATQGSIVWREGGPAAQFLELPVAEESEAFLPALLEKKQVLFDVGETLDQTAMITRSLDFDTKIYVRSGFSLVSESEMTQFRYRVTEKPFKPLSNCHPFILFGNHQALDIIRAFGFQTFGDWIDESYDEIADPSERFNAAYKAFLEFRSRGSEVILKDKALRRRLLENLAHATGGVQRLYETTWDKDLCTKIESAVPFA